MGHYVQILLIAIVLAVANGLSAETEIPRPTTKLTTTEIPTTHRTVPTRTTETPTETPTTETTPTTQTPIPTTTVRPTTQPTTTERTTTSRPTTQTTETPTTTEKPTTTPIPTTHTPTIPTTTSAPTDTPTTVTPDIITNPESTTSAQVTTEFPIWTTTSTPNVTTSSPTTQTPTSTTTTTSITTVSPTESPTPTTTTGNSTGTTPNSTTTTLPTPTLPPTPDAPSFPWNVSYPGPHGNYCIMAVFAARVDIVYENVDKQIVQTGFDLPKNASINTALSMCDPYAEEEVFALDFHSESISQGYFAAIFDRNNATNHSTLFELMISVPITEDMFPGIDPSVLNKNHFILLSAKNLSLFDTEYYHSFSCMSTIKTNLSSIEVTNGHLNGALNWMDSSKNKVIFHNATLETSDMQLQTFMLSNRSIDFFMISEKCKGDQPDTLWTVDFIVAGVMGALVAFVLIAYFVGKRIQLKKMQEDSLEAALVNNE